MPSANSRILAAFQMMRLPLVITAISNTQAALLLARHRWEDSWTACTALTVGLMSLGLYAFGMVSNDIVDYRRDQYLAPHRPLPSGRFGLQAAHILAALLLIFGVASGLAFAFAMGGGFPAAFFLTWTVILIFFYNLAGKFVGAVGILTLGLVRFFHAAIAEPNLSVIWHPLLLMDHVVLLSAICYILEGKRPRLDTGHRWFIVISLLGLNLLFAGGIILATWLRMDEGDDLAGRIGWKSGLIWPLVATVVFAAITTSVILSLREPAGLSHRELLDRRRKTGRRLMLFGLLWLVIYDATFVLGFA